MKNIIKLLKEYFFKGKTIDSPLNLSPLKKIDKDFLKG